MSIKPQEKNQFDLFGHAQTVDKKIRKKTRFFLPDIKNSLTVSCETAVFFMIAFLMTSIIAFSLGVEKGRHDESKRRAITPRPQAALDMQPHPKSELKKGALNVATPKSKNIKGR